ncbi:MAG: sulfite exporter TauE/SafE family protein [Deltaproteobacteria bacterium]|nr:sulfite exporter TauE/SafE family protein [Deltaproteobacteria bacterium]MBI2341167.1 sulfite exporter TauE/SafE family protein [Deltaproteobacteria bacterium]
MLLLLLTGLLAGILGGFFGIGGGIIIIPILIYLFGFAQHMAQGTTLAAMIPPIGLMAAYAYWRAGSVDIKAAALIAIGFFAGGWIGGSLVQYIPEISLRKAFAVLLLLVAVKMWVGK